MKDTTVLALIVLLTVLIFGVGLYSTVQGFLSKAMSATEQFQSK